MRRLLKDAEHLVRLAILFAAGVMAFLIVRALLVPPDFGEYGHFRTGAMADNQKRALAYAGRAACTECHGEEAALFAKGSHARIGCESCHGALAAHVADSDHVKPAKLDVVALCSRCHSENQARPKKQPQVDVEKHSEGNACTECHDAHSPAQ
jgi:hypothetical protein